MSYPSGKDMANWMGGLPESLHSSSLNSIAIPGTHDSFSWGLDVTGDIGPDNLPFVKTLVQLFPGTAKAIIAKWSKTQSLNTVEQLKAGIRYFDIRVTLKKDTQELHAVHGLYGRKMEMELQDISQFLDNHSKEIVLLDFNHFYSMDEENHIQCISLIQHIFGPKLCPLLDTDSVTLDMLWENGLQVLVFYHHDIVTNHLNLWPGCTIPSPWPDTMDINKFITFLEQNYRHGRSPCAFYVTQGILTPDSSTVVTNLCGDLRNAVAKRVCGPLHQWLCTKRCGLTTVNVVISDFVEMDNFIGTVVDMNYK
ncbi:PI-PLC X domain-containing protein 3 [Lingula anatina]|uniref:PI-PLC X domain-containing protein 3 n=1 Tax=Lingula anatina TaxID=7574 RepID=A0A1S3IE30_LINAN|nr:PI-PLC X domain-containing protein 3 [Lingula anatina]|eukprot:XP_013396515.1 PI-PLC X domain-containing protein 3 [Lingula anatina]